MLDRVDFLPRERGDRVLLGAAVRGANLFANPLYRGTWLQNFDSMTPENEMKFASTEPEEGRFNFSTADSMVDLAVANGKLVRGHTLVYGAQLAGWLTDRLLPWTRADLADAMRSFITTTVKHFAGRVGTWDVVNEAFNSDGTYQQNLWYKAIGPSYIADAFRFAHAADPSARLFYNDAGAEADGPKQRAVLAMVGSLKAQGVPIDGVGFESHMRVGAQLDGPALGATLARFARLGVAVEITEMDVPLRTWKPLGAEELAAQADTYRASATACWDVAACDRFTTWGIGDAVTWLGSEQAPLLFDRWYAAKPALSAVERVLHRS
jgi:endo-1,4-beta-xylanase